MNTLIKIFPKYCSCCRKLGEIQYDFEIELEKLITKNKDKPLNILQEEICKKFDIVKMCCLNNIYNAPTYFFVDTYFGQIFNANINNNNKELICENGPNTIYSIEPLELP